MEQRSEEWFAARCGKMTASRVGLATARTRSGWGASRANLMAELIIERLTGMPTPSFCSAAMQWGVDHEDDARVAYEFFKGKSVVEVGFVQHPHIDQAGASPDGRVDSDGLLEIKCPNSATHLATLLDQCAPKIYIKQMQWQMACEGRQWVDFVSFDPRFPSPLDFFCVRVERDDELIGELEADVVEFLAEMETKILKLEELK